MKLSIVDIVFIIFAVSMLSLLIWEIIPDGLKAYWKYLRLTRKDHKTRYSFIFKR